MIRYQGDIKRKLILFIGFIVLVLLALNILPRFFSDDDLLVLPEEFEYLVEIPAKGILVRDEELYYSEVDGDIYKVAAEGERVRVGQIVVDILLQQDTTNLKSELNSIENMIGFYNEIQTEEDTDATVSLNGVEVLVSKLQSQIAARDYQGVHDSREVLLLQSTTFNELSQTYISGEITMESLLERRESLYQQILKYDKKIYSRNSGLVSYNIDGWEESLHPTSLNEISVDILDIDKEINGQKKEAGSNPVFKIIDDYQWLVIVKVDGELYSKFEIDDRLEISISSNEELLVSAKLPVIDTIEEDNTRLLVLEGTKYIEKLYDKRKVDISIVTVKENTLRIPERSLVERDGINGVLVKEFYGVVTFRPVEVIANDDRYAYVSKGDSNGYIKSGEESVRTISIFSEIIIEPESAQVGDILK